MPVYAQAEPRRPHTVARLAWSLWALAMALEVAAIPLWLANHAVLLSRFGTTEDFAPHVFLVPGYATVGAVIAARRRNRIGWLFLAFGLVAALLSFASAYFIRGAIVAPGSLPAARVAGWIGPVLWPSSYLFLRLLLLLFPDGRLPSPRWRPVALALGDLVGPGHPRLRVVRRPRRPFTASPTPTPWGSRRLVTLPGRRWPTARGAFSRLPLPLPRWRRWCGFAAPTRCSASS